MAKNITSRSESFPKWYQDVITAGELADQAPVRGCMVIRPTGYAIWEAMQSNLDQKFKETGHVNAYFPVLIPKSFFTKEAEHVEGFAPELAIVTHAGGKELEEPLAVRPTSETIIGHMYSQWLNSYRDLPILMNQWCNVMRWEKRSRLFLRTSEFLWQEGHTVHETAEQAKEETLQMLEIYRDFLENTCAIPVIPGKKPEHEKFPGAEVTYTVEAMMQDNKALQSATSHDLGQVFSKAFDIKFLGRKNEQEYGWTTSWGASTRMIGALIMAHGDDDGIIIPPRLAPVKVAIVPIIPKEKHKEAVYAHVDEIAKKLKAKLGNLQVKVDDRDDMRPGDKFFHWIQRGVPLRIEVGPKDVENNGAMLVRRDNREKIKCNVDEIETLVDSTLEEIQTALYQRAVDHRTANTYTIDSYDEFKDIFANDGGFVLAHWDGTAETAKQIQDETKATIRVLPEDQTTPGKCIYSGKESKQRVIFSVAY
ncbi:MAG: prolyl-tRNA synthetase [bacterium]|jgi:prolyl-tRNA synthetase